LDKLIFEGQLPSELLLLASGLLQGPLDLPYPLLDDLREPLWLSTTSEDLRNQPLVDLQGLLQILIGLSESLQVVWFLADTGSRRLMREATCVVGGVRVTLVVRHRVGLRLARC
jgi:hypothetical protein